MKLSIIVPVYNVSSYLRDTLENILAQDYTDFELLLIDDGSSDESGKICDEFAKQDKRVVVVHKENGGVSSARNLGVSLSKGEYIGFVDSDDIIEPNMYSIITELAEKYGADVVQCRHNRNNAVEGVDFSGDIRELDGRTFVKEIPTYKGGEYTNQVALWSKIYKKELFKYAHFPEGRTYEDEQETYKICLHAKKVITIPDELYHYIKRENSIITGVTAKKMYDRQYALMDKLDYTPVHIPEIFDDCVKSFVNYSKRIFCDLYRLHDEKYLKLTMDNFYLHYKQVKSYLNKYDKIYFKLLKIKAIRNIILKNDFEPVQKAVRKIKGE